MRDRIEAVTTTGTPIDLFGVEVDAGTVIALGIHAPTALRKGARVTVNGRQYRLVSGVRAGLHVVGGPAGLELDRPVELVGEEP